MEMSLKAKDELVRIKDSMIEALLCEKHEQMEASARENVGEVRKNEALMREKNKGMKMMKSP